MELNRRRFLRATGLGTAAVALGMDQATAAAPPDWEKLRTRLAGPLYAPQDEGYAEAKRGFFTLYGTQRPAVVARCARVEDVQACVEVAAETGTRIAARSGGHSYAGYSTPHEGLMVDVSEMNTVEVHSDGTAVVGAGTRLIDVYEALAKAGRLIPGGTCPSVGIAGLALGGGIGVVARKYGLTCDRILAARIVTPDSRVRTVSPVSDPDLFWALRGGGGGNFGIVTSFTFRTAPVSELTVFEVEFPAAALSDLLGGWQSWQSQAPDEVWSGLGVMGAADATTWVTGCFVGVEQAVQPHLDALTRAAGAQPLTRRTRQLSHFETMRYFAGCSELSTKECQPNWTGAGGELDRGAYVSTSRMLTKPIADPDGMAALLRSSPGLYTIIDGFGGAIARVPSDATPFPYRKAVASMQITHAVEGSETFARQAIGHVRDMIAGEYGSTGYVNYIDPQMPDWARAYYGGNLPRLRSVARRYDPDQVFGFAQGIGP